MALETAKVSKDGTPLTLIAVASVFVLVKVPVEAEQKENQADMAKTDAMILEPKDPVHDTADPVFVKTDFDETELTV